MKLFVFLLLLALGEKSAGRGCTYCSNMIRLEHAFGCRCTRVRRAVYCCACSLDKTRNIYVTTSGDEVEQTE